MKNNPNQEIHTDYRANDIFKPINANRLAESIHYDFVITQEMLDKYMEQNPGDTTIGIGILLNSNSDGTKNDTYNILAKAPVSIYIAAKTPDNVVYDFTGAFITTTSSTILDFSDFMDNGQITVAKTDGAVNVYSEYPYRANITGGVNFHSTPKAPLTIDYVKNNGVIRIGAYKTIGSSPINVFRNGDIKIITQEQLSGHGFADKLISDTQNPDLFVADWMGGGCSGDLGYSIDETDTVQYGLFDRFAESYRLGTRASLFVKHAQSTSVYHRDHGGSYDITFSNASEGRKITIHKDGTITKEDTGVGGGGGRAALVDFDTNGYVNHKWIVGDKASVDTLSILKPGFTSFLSPKQDMARYIPGGESGNPPDWYNNYPGFSFENGLVSTLDWFFWYAISDYTDDYSGEEAPVDWYVNPRKDLCVAIDKLKEGIVYEINLYCVMLPSKNNYSIGTPSKTYGRQASPVTQYVNSPTLDGDSLGRPTVTFTNYGGGSSDVYRWGEKDRLGNPQIKPVFYNVGQPHNAGPSSNAYEGNQLRIMARAKLPFTCLNGSVFIMSY